jgi:hypothetical protein
MRGTSASCAVVDNGFAGRRRDDARQNDGLLDRKRAFHAGLTVAGD